MTTPEKAIEVFYSYAHEDEALRKELEKHLSVLQHQGHIAGWHDRLISAGTAWAEEIDSHLNTAGIILLLISASFLASKYCYSIEMKRALERDNTREARVIPVILRPVDWQAEPALHKLQALPTNGKAVTTWPMPPTYDEAFADIAKGIRKVVEELRANPLTVSPKVAQLWNVPHRRNPFFTGREELLRQLHDRLSATGTTALTQAQAISGLGGIGKTQTAIEYAYRYRTEYQAIFWVRAASRDALIADVVEIARLLQLPEQAEQDQEKIIAAVKRWLANSPGWLLILDNADDLAMVSDFLAFGDKGHILLTTRAQVAGTLAESIDVDKMGKEEGTLLLLRRAKVLKPGMSLDQVSVAARTQAEGIVEEMGGLPLALDQAGAYIEETGRSLADYLSLYHTRRKELLQRRSQFSPDYPASVATTWSLAFQKVEQANPAASALLQLCAFLDPDAIAEELLTRGADQLGKVLGPVARDAFKLDQALFVLRQYSLLRRNPNTKTLSIHRLVQEVIKDTMDQRTQRQWTERAIRALNTAFPEVDQANLTPCDPYLPHVLACVPLIAPLGLSFSEAADLLHNTGRYLYHRARYTEAEPLYQHALSIYEKVLGPEHPYTATTLHELARLFQDQDDYPRAEPLYQRALHIHEKMEGPNHPRTADTLHELARLYYHQGDYAHAEPLYYRLSASTRKCWDPNIPTQRPLWMP